MLAASADAMGVDQYEKVPGIMKPGPARVTLGPPMRDERGGTAPRGSV